MLTAEELDRALAEFEAEQEAEALEREANELERELAEIFRILKGQRRGR